MNNEEEKVLREFLVDRKSLEAIKDTAEKFNILEVFGFARNEIRHSFVLKWLLDPRENHGLGDAVTTAFLHQLVAAEPERYDNSFELLMLDCSDFIVEREKNDIDLFLYSEAKDVVVVIENKIGSQVHASKGYDSQLEKYEDFVDKEYDQVKTKIYVYLTPQDESLEDYEEKWQIVSYETLVEVIEEVYKDNCVRIEPAVDSLIKNYIEIIRRDIVNDEQLTKLCNDIYHKHKKALDLIYQHSDMGMNPSKRLVREVLKELEKQGKIKVDAKNKNAFHTTKMTEFLPNLSEANGSWGDQHVYRYWFKFDREDDYKVRVIFEIGFYGVDEGTDTMNKFDGFIEVLHPKQKGKSSRYKRVKSFSSEQLNDSDDQKSKEKICSMVEKVLKNEENWIKKCKDYIQKKK